MNLPSQSLNLFWIFVNNFLYWFFNYSFNRFLNYFFNYFLNRLLNNFLYYSFCRFLLLILNIYNWLLESSCLRFILDNLSIKFPNDSLSFLVFIEPLASLFLNNQKSLFQSMNFSCLILDNNSQSFNLTFLNIYRTLFHISSFNLKQRT